MSVSSQSTTTMPTELLKISPLILYEIATDIQVSGKWKKFAFAVGFSTENILMMEMSNSERFPAENVMYHWFSKNPKVEDLAKHLCDLDLQKPLHRLQKYLPSEKFKKFELTLSNNRRDYYAQENISEFCEESTTNGTTSNTNSCTDDIKFQTQLSNSSTTSSSVPTTPEAGLINVDLHLPSIPRSGVSDTPINNLNSPISPDENEEEKSIFQTILCKKSTQFSVDEFNDEDFISRFIEGKFSACFHKKLRGNNFSIQSFSLEKVYKSKKNQKKLYNIIWSLTNFRLQSLQILSGYCFLENYLFLILPENDTKPLFDLLHRPHINNHEIMSFSRRLMILRIVGEVLSFLHCRIPFGACHGNIESNNILVGPNIVLLSGFEKFYTDDPEYLKGLEKILKPEIQIEEYYKRDIKNYLELICETVWNIPSYKKDFNDDSMIEDIKRNITVPKVKYPGWRDELHDEIKSIIINYSSESKGIPKIEEIVDDLLKSDRSLEPPSYNEIEYTDSCKHYE